MKTNFKTTASHIFRLTSVLAIVFCLAFFLAPTVCNTSASASSTDINISLLVKLQKFLLSDGTLSSTDASLCDLDKNGCLNGLDSTLLKCILVKQYQPPVVSTTTSTTTTSTTTSTTTTSTTTTSFVPPTVDDLLEEYGFGPSDEEYNGLIESAELFGIDYYKIVYSEELIEYSLAIPSDSFSAGQNCIGYWAFQMCPITDEETIDPGYDYETTGHNLAIWRPLIESDGETTRTDGILVYTSMRDYFYDYYYWVLIPCKLDEKTGELVEDLQLLYPTTANK